MLGMILEEKEVFVNLPAAKADVLKAGFKDNLHWKKACNVAFRLLSL